MRAVTYSMSMTLDGFITGPDGGIDWGGPDEELFALATDELRTVGVHLLGRRLYETMLYWETAEEDPALGFSTQEFAALWRALPKVVFSRTLTSVEGNARLATGSLSDEIACLRAEAADDDDIAIGGATLAAAAAELGLIDEYRARIHPVLVGGGIPFFPRGLAPTGLELVRNRTLGSGVVCLNHRVLR